MTKTTFSLSDNVFVAALFPLTLFLFGPLMIYFHNTKMFTLYPATLLITLTVMSALGTGVLLAILFGSSLIAHPVLTKGLSSLFTASGILIWVQGNFLVRQYGPFDGNAINWQQYSFFDWLDIVVWALGILIMLFCMRWTYRHASSVAKLVILIQLISIVIMSQNLHSSEINRYEENNAQKYAFSRKNNVIILVLDTFSNFYFNTAVQPYPKYTDFLDGFTYYSNTISGYPRTQLVVTTMLTGKNYQNQVPVKEFMREAFLSEQSLPYILKRKGFNVYFPKAYYNYVSPEISSSVQTAPMSLLYSPEKLRLLMLVSAFRYAPQPLKKPIFRHIQDTLAFAKGSRKDPAPLPRDLVFLKEFESSAHSDDMLSGTMKYYHLNGMHAPHLINENLQVEQLPNNKSGYTRAAWGNMKLVERFLNKLKLLEVYDSSLIIIVADHGAMYPEKPYRLSYGDMSMLNPLLLIKQPGERGSMRTEEKPVKHGDLRATVLDSLGMDTSAMKGTSILQDMEQQNIERYYYSYRQWLDEDWDREYAPDLVEYVITGHSNDERNWKRTGTVFIPNAKIITEDPLKSEPKYSFGTTVRFGRLSSKRSYLLDGWGHLGVNELHPVQKKAHIVLQLESVPSQHMVFNAVLTPLSSDTQVRQVQVIVSINNKRVGSWTVTKEFQGIRALVHKSYLKEHDKNIITFEFPNAAMIKGYPGEPDGYEGLNIILHALSIDSYT